MNLPFLRYIPGLGGPPIRQVVAGGNAANSPAATALHYLLTELPELLLAAVLDLPTKQLLATYAAERHYQPSLVAQSVATVVQQAEALRQGQAGEEVEEVLLTLSGQLHLLRLRPGSQQVLFMAISQHDTNLALARQLAQQAVKLLAGASS
ncbi:MAG: hypothetical protein EOO60_11650 [Hymenobacter sp.]|nr:MAG: hypothetical protein EOO60_11650 [Hymenobacter sp.]